MAPTAVRRTAAQNQKNKTSNTKVKAKTKGEGKGKKGTPKNRAAWTKPNAAAEWPLPAPGNVATQLMGNFVLYGEPIAQGGQGKVFLCTEYGSALPAEPSLVGKLLSVGSTNRTVRAGKPESRRFKDALREIDILSSYTHPHIVPVIDVVMGCGKVLLVMPYLRFGDLSAFLVNTIRRSLVELEVVAAFRQLLAAIQFLKSKKVVHRDVKPDNALVERYTLRDNMCDMILQLTDFGLSKMCGDGVGEPFLSARVGTLPFMAPEMYDRRDNVSFPVDCWGLGVTLFFMCTGLLPGDVVEEFRGQMVPCPCNATPERLTMDITSRIPVSLQPVALGLLDMDPDKRMEPREAAAALDKHFINPVDFSAATRNRAGHPAGDGNSQVVPAPEVDKYKQEVAALKEQLRIAAGKEHAALKEIEALKSQCARAKQEATNANEAYEKKLGQENAELKLQAAASNEAHATELDRRVTAQLQLEAIQAELHKAKEELRQATERAESADFAYAQKLNSES